MNRTVIALIVLALAAGGAYWYMTQNKAAAPADPAVGAVRAVWAAPEAAVAAPSRSWRKGG